jgi:hypothetical protein
MIKETTKEAVSIFSILEKNIMLSGPFAIAGYISWGHSYFPEYSFIFALVCTVLFAGGVLSKANDACEKWRKDVKAKREAKAKLESLLEMIPLLHAKELQALKELVTENPKRVKSDGVWITLRELGLVEIKLVNRSMAMGSTTGLVVKANEDVLDKLK